MCGQYIFNAVLSLKAVLRARIRNLFGLRHLYLCISCLWVYTTAIDAQTLSAVQIQSPQPATQHSKKPKKLTYTIVETYKHQSNTFTQGLELYNGELIESSGLYGRSFIQRSKPAKITDSSHPESTSAQPAPPHTKPLNKAIFAEGITVFNNRLYMLTWRKQTLLELNPNTFEVIRTASYKGEGWGLTHNHQHLIMSNGSAKITFRNPTTFAIEKTLTVRLNSTPLKNINELEYAQNLIWANVWQTPFIVAINPNSGTVEAILDLTPLVDINHTKPRQSVLNGIAFNPEENNFWVTGKLWPRLYKIEIHWPQEH